MSEHHKTLISTQAMAPVLATPTIGHAEPAKDLTAGVSQALFRQNLLTERQTQTRGLEVDRRTPCALQPGFVIPTTKPGGAIRGAFISNFT